MAILLLVESEPAAAEDLVSWWGRMGGGPTLPILIGRSHASRLAHDPGWSLPPVVIGETDIRLEHGGRALLADAAGDAIGAGLAVLARAGRIHRQCSSCPHAA
jgi:hypothetical protein